MATGNRRRATGEGSVYKTADGRWRGAVDLGWENGKRKRKYVSGATQADALAAFKKASRSIELGVVTDERLTVGKWLDRWLAEVKSSIAVATHDNYSTLVKLHITPIIGRKLLTKLSPDDVSRLLRLKSTQRLPRKKRMPDGKIVEVVPEGGYSPRTVQLIRTVLVEALKLAERWDYIPRNVAALTDGPRVPDSEGRTLTPDEARTLIETAHGDRLEALYLTMLSLGLRRGEALGITWPDVDLETGLLSVRRGLKREGGRLVLGELKTAASRRTLNLPAPLVDVLKVHRARQAVERMVAEDAWTESGLVFTTALGTPIDPSNFRHYFSALTVKAGLGHWHPHELRHSAASIMLAQGVPLEVVSETLGHTSIRITKDVYGHLLGAQRKHAADAMGAALWGAVDE